MKRIVIGAWRFVTFVAGAVFGLAPGWLADKQAEEERRSRLV
jgi:hypothetical protein